MYDVALKVLGAAALAVGAVAAGALVYWAVTALYKRLRVFAQRFLEEHRHEVDSVKIALDELSCAIKRGSNAIPVKLLGERKTGGTVIIETTETVSLDEAKELLSREQSAPMVVTL